MKLECAVPWKLDNRVRRGGMPFCKKDSHGGCEEQGAEPSWGFTDTSVESIAGHLNEGLQIKTPQALTMGQGG